MSVFPFCRRHRSCFQVSILIGNIIFELASFSGYRPTLKVYGKSLIQSRAIAAYSTTPDLVVKYSGQLVEMHHPYPPVLAKLQSQMEDALGMTASMPSTSSTNKDESQTSHGGFNHVMLNRYDDGTVYIGRHNDTKENNASSIAFVFSDSS